MILVTSKQDRFRCMTTARPVFSIWMAVDIYTAISI